MKFFPRLCLLILTAAVAARVAAQTPAPVQKTFATPDAAIAALSAAVKIHDKPALLEIFGPELSGLLTGDEARDKANSQKFAAALAEGAKPVPEGENKIVFEIGAKQWPFPIPLVKTDSLWHFDTAAGKEEMLSRHIGRDELHAIGVLESSVAAQKQKSAGDVAVPKPIHGYIFKALTGKGAGGQFALAAYPKKWRHSGIMTFLVNSDGKVYQRDLGEKHPRSPRA